MALYEAQQRLRDGHRVVAVNLAGRNPDVLKPLAQCGADIAFIDCERTGLATPEALQQDWHFYLAYNMFRIAAILQGIAKRVEAGTASSEQARASAAGARPMAELAWRYAQMMEQS